MENKIIEEDYKEIVRLLRNLNPHNDLSLSDELWLQRTVLEVELEGRRIGRKLAISTFKNAIQRQNLSLHFSKIISILEASDKIYGG